MLGGLKTLELIYEKAYLPEISYMFKHALTHDVAYSTLLLERRKDAAPDRRARDRGALRRSPARALRDARAPLLRGPGSGSPRSTI